MGSAWAGAGDRRRSESGRHEILEVVEPGRARFLGRRHVHGRERSVKQGSTRVETAKTRMDL